MSDNKMPASHRAAAPRSSSYMAQRPYLDRTIGDLARDQAMRRPDAIAFVGSSETTFEKLLVDAEALLAALLELGLRAGDVISFQLPNWTEAAVINLAAALGGFVINPIVTIYRDREVSDMLARSGSKILFACHKYRGYDFAAMIERIHSQEPSLDFREFFVRGSQLPSYKMLVDSARGKNPGAKPVDPDSLKMLLFTSGTTGRAKGVMHSHNTLSRAAQNAIICWSIGEGDGILMPSPVTHISGFSNGLDLPFIAGTKTVLMEYWNSRDAVSLIDGHQVAGTVAATPFLTELAAAAAAAQSSLPSLRFFACGGAPVPSPVVRSANAAFGRLCAFRIYGSSEVPFVTLGYFRDQDAELAASTDGAVFDYDVLILDDNGEAVAPGKEGEIAARGPSMFIGYSDEPASERTHTAEGYFLTGDLGKIVSVNGLVITGRKKDLIIRGGENISAAEIEEIITTYPGVADVAVVAMPHDRLGEGVCAFIVAAADVAVSALTTFIHSKGLARQKTPEKFYVLDELPRTPSGKVRKDVLRGWAADPNKEKVTLT